MSNNVQLGVALVCGAVGYGLTCGVTNLNSGVGLAVGAVVAGITLIIQSKLTPQQIEKEKELVQKIKKAAKPLKKAVQQQVQQAVPVIQQAIADVKKAAKNKKGKKSEPKSPKSPTSPVAQSPAPKGKTNQQKSPSVENDEKKELTKTQLQKLKKKAKKELEEKGIAEEIARKAQEAKREIARVQKAAAKAIKKGVADVKSKAQQVGQQVQHVGQQVGQQVQQVGQQVGQQVQHMGQQVQHMGQQVQHQVQQQMQSKPAHKAHKAHQDEEEDEEEEKEEEKEEEELEEGWERPSARKTIKLSRGGGDSNKGAKSKAHKGVSNDNTSKTALEVKVPRKHHGSLIGPGGSFLKLIQDKTGAKVDMPKRDGGGLGVVISGSASAVAAAEQVIKDIVLKGYSPVTHPDFVDNEMILDDPSLVGRIAGPKGTFLQKIQQQTGASLKLPERNSDRAVISIYGKPAEIMAAKLAITDLVNQGFSDITHPGWIIEEVEFPASSLGKLIGTAGSKIKELQHEYAVKIDTPKKDDGKATQDVIHIKGPQQNVDKAKEAISQLLVVPEEDETIPEADPEWQQEPEQPEW